MNPEFEQIAAGIIQSNFDIEHVETDELLLHKIRLALIEKIDFLINNDFENLLRILYRIDVDEDKAKAMLAEKSDQKPSEVLADLVIERMIEKAAARINNPVPRGDLNE